MQKAAPEAQLNIKLEIGYETYSGNHSYGFIGDGFRRGTAAEHFVHRH